VDTSLHPVDVRTRTKVEALPIQAMRWRGGSAPLKPRGSPQESNAQRLPTQWPVMWCCPLSALFSTRPLARASAAASRLLAAYGDLAQCRRLRTDGDPGHGRLG
jgi:hypothetical protein